MSDILYINDNNLLLQQGGSFHRSQGYAWLKNGSVFFDFDDANNAVAACRLEPQQINSRYWQQCEQTALSGNDSGMRHAADLIWRHLSELKGQHGLAEVALIVPSHYQAANLQLLLGITKSAGLEATSLLNKAVLAVAKQQPQVESVLHLDVQLHQTVCSEVLSSAGRWQLGKVEIMHEVGLQAMQDSLLKAAQERFIQSDRFDPLHYAETEQQLFDQLPKLAQSIHTDGKANMVVVQAGNQHACSIDAKQWIAALQPFLAALTNAQLENNPQQRLYDFNGFAALDIQGERRNTVSQSKTSSEILNLSTAHDLAGKVIYQTELPAKNDAGTNTTAPGKPDTAKPQAISQPAVSAEPAAKFGSVANQHPTHLLHNGIAVQIGRAQVSLADNALSVSIGESSNLASLLKVDQLFVMADPSRLELQVNDRLGSNLADGVITVIRVE